MDIQTLEGRAAHFRGVLLHIIRTVAGATEADLDPRQRQILDHLCAKAALDDTLPLLEEHQMRIIHAICLKMRKKRKGV